MTSNWQVDKAGHPINPIKMGQTWGILPTQLAEMQHVSTASWLQPRIFITCHIHFSANFAVPVYCPISAPNEAGIPPPQQKTLLLLLSSTSTCVTS